MDGSIRPVVAGVSPDARALRPAHVLPAPRPHRHSTNVTKLVKRPRRPPNAAASKRVKRPVLRNLADEAATASPPIGEPSALLNYFARIDMLFDFCKWLQISQLWR
jgi:hypothetical protein